MKRSLCLNWCKILNMSLANSLRFVCVCFCFSFTIFVSSSSCVYRYVWKKGLIKTLYINERLLVGRSTTVVLDLESTYRAGMKPCLYKRSNLPRCSRYVFVTLYLKRFSGYVQKDLWTFSCLWLAILLRILANPWVETGTNIQSLLHVNGFPYCYFSTEKHNLTLNTENQEVVSTCSTSVAPQIVPETTVVSVMTATDDTWWHQMKAFSA